MCLDAELQTLWSNYLALEARGSRKSALEALSLFIGQIENVANERREQWVASICDKAIQSNDGSVPIRQPLFDRVIFPFLLLAYRQGRAPSARRLAEFSQLVYKSKRCMEQLEGGEFTKRLLLESALSQDADDRRAKELLVKEFARGFDYAVHEVPAGVLCGMNGASVEDCDQMLIDLERFNALAEELGQSGPYRDSMKHWRFHFSTYREYLRRRSGGQSYGEYLRNEAASN